MKRFVKVEAVALVLDDGRRVAYLWDGATNRVIQYLNVDLMSEVVPYEFVTAFSDIGAPNEDAPKAAGSMVCMSNGRDLIIAEAPEAFAARVEPEPEAEPLRLTDRGVWTADEQYNTLDFVTTKTGKKTYLAIAPSKSTSKGVLQNRAFWCVITLPEAEAEAE